MNDNSVRICWGWCFNFNKLWYARMVVNAINILWRKSKKLELKNIKKCSYFRFLYRCRWQKMFWKKWKFLSKSVDNIDLKNQLKQRTLTVGVSFAVWLASSLTKNWFDQKRKYHYNVLFLNIGPLLTKSWIDRMGFRSTFTESIWLWIDQRWHLLKNSVNRLC